LERDQKFYHRDRNIPFGFIRFQIPCGIDDLVYKENNIIKSYKSRDDMMKFIENSAT